MLGVDNALFTLSRRVAPFLSYCFFIYSSGLFGDILCLFLIKNKSFRYTLRGNGKKVYFHPVPPLSLAGVGSVCLGVEKNKR